MKASKLGNEEVTHSDRISYLPEDLLFRILSLIPITNAMSTSLLSKRWRSVWKMMPTLDYDEESCLDIAYLGFDEFCGRSLQLHQAPLLKTLNLKLWRHSDSLDTLLFPNIRSTLLEMTITSTSYSCYYDTKIKFQNNLRVFQTLVVLKLQGNIRLDFADSPVRFRSLRSLHLTRVSFQDKGDSFSTLLSACPVLEDLYFLRLSRHFRSLITISVPSLRRLLITSDDLCDDLRYVSDDPRLEINAPSLKYLKIKNFIGSLTFTEDMPRLMEADVAVHRSQTEKFLRFFTSAEFLSIHLYASKVKLLADAIPQRLLHLELHVYNKIPRNLLLHLLKQSPKLQVLKLHEKHMNRTRPVKDQPPSIRDPSSVPECLSLHLETLEWRGYQGTEEENEVAVYILQNAPRLKTAAISIYWIGTRGGEKDQVMIKDLKSMPKASTSCQLVIRLDNFS